MAEETWANIIVSQDARSPNIGKLFLDLCPTFSWTKVSRVTAPGSQINHNASPFHRNRTLEAKTEVDSTQSEPKAHDHGDIDNGSDVKDRGPTETPIDSLLDFDSGRQWHSGHPQNTQRVVHLHQVLPDARS